jgi:hypothetical protein
MREMLENEKDDCWSFGSMWLPCHRVDSVRPYSTLSY